MVPLISAVKQEDPEEQAFLPPEELHVPAGMTIVSGIILTCICNEW